MSPLVTPDAIARAAEGLRGVAIRTPLLPAPWLADAVDAAGGAEGHGDAVPHGGAGAHGPEAAGSAPRLPRSDIRLKCENLQHAGAFKLRGAYTMVSRLDEADRRRGIITYSSGNHAQATALAARIFGVPAVVVMPTTAPAVKVEGARRLGADVVFEGTTSVERQRRAEAIAAERGLAVIPPFDHPDIIAGQGTVGREILEDWPEVDAVLVPIGGGGLLSGIAAWVRHASPGCTIIGVEPENADAMRRSLDAGEPVTIEARPTIADGLAPVRPGDLTFDHARQLVDEVVTVSDDAIAHAAGRLLHESRIVVEFSGAAGVAALLSGRWHPDGRRTAIVLSGGNRRIVEAG